MLSNTSIMMCLIIFHIIRVPSLAVFGGAGLFFGLFFTSSWFGKNVLEQVPIYNKKYAERDPD